MFFARGQFIGAVTPQTLQGGGLTQSLRPGFQDRADLLRGEGMERQFFSNFHHDFTSLPQPDHGRVQPAGRFASGHLN